MFKQEEDMSATSGKTALVQIIVVGVVFVSFLTAAWCDQNPESQKKPKIAEVYSKWPFDAKEARRRQAETAVALGVPKGVSLDLGQNVMLKLVLVPAGRFVMGSPATEKGRQDNEVQHEVTITKPFYIGVYKVTQAQYQRIMGKNPSTYKGASFPVAATSWEDATEFCKRVSEKTHRTVALPTEAQWECMCRAGTATAYSFGADHTRLGAYSWGVFNWGGRMHPVGRKRPNAFGIYDVHGLMWEWARGFYGDYDPAKKIDPEDPTSGSEHVARAGTYRSRPPFLRSAIRIAATVTEGAKEEGADRFGFRVEVDVK
jgi:formylglycine-generating enzyme required for sulfatase activity